MTVNRRILLADRPDGLVTEDCLQRVEEPIPLIADGEALVRVLSLSVDPTNRVWMREEDSYLPAIRIGDVVRAAGLGEVVESRNPAYSPGDLVMGLPGWQDYWTLTAGDAGQVVPPGIAVEDMLSIYGVTGVTAYFGLLEIGQPKPGETVVVSGAAGGVGSVAGQIARIKEAGRVVGIAGTDEKCRWVVDDLGFDACINYKTEDVAQRLREECPDGIDVYFDNVGGAILDAVLGQINIGARIPLCGAISEYTLAESPGIKNYKALIMQRGRMEGFIILDYVDRFLEAIMELAPWVAEGRIKYAVEVVDGLEHAPDALNRLFTGDHSGKLIVRVSEPSAS
ncbi:MAG: NADP-dependent oxidoreductase [Acidimicrobiia bacterium]